MTPLAVVAVLLVTLVQCKPDDLKLCEKLFKALIAKEGEELTAAEYEYRLSVFTANVLDDGDLDGDGDFSTGPTILDMYTEEELYDMNHGAAIDERVEQEVLEMRRRGESVDRPVIVESIERAPSSYDVTSEIAMNEPVAQGVCGNCYLHVVVAAIEIAYTLQTGKLVKFSEQEMTDCYYKGCSGGDYRSVGKTMALTDHLSERTKYGPYLNYKDKTTSYTCKAGTTPDALLDIKVTGVVDVTAKTVDEAVSKYGSVMTCMDWSTECASLGKTYQGGVYKGATVKQGCEHAVLIVGYTSEYYKVRNSHGKAFGEEGYFRIERGNNACGIEDQMAALMTEPRDSKPDLASNGCPSDKPNYCEKTFVCASGACVEPTAEKVKKKRVKRDLSIRKRACSPDKSPSCYKYVKYCSRSVFKTNCATTCGTECDDIDPAPAPVKVDEPHGPCTIPTIPNGYVYYPSSGTIASGQKLYIRCNTGYKLKGDSVTCLIQDTFSPDTRLIPECIKTGAEDLVGSGADYQGTKSATVDGKTCLFWNKEVIQGYVALNPEQTSLYMLGNHNYCRNAGGALAVPWCIVDSAGNTGFCYQYPACEVCQTPEDQDKYCDEYAGDCAFSTPDRTNRPNNAWTLCPATCCLTAGC